MVSMSHHGRPPVADEGWRWAEGALLFDTRGVEAEGHQVEGRQEQQVRPHNETPPH